MGWAEDRSSNSAILNSWSLTLQRLEFPQRGDFGPRHFLYIARNAAAATVITAGAPSPPLEVSAPSAIVVHPVMHKPSAALQAKAAAGAAGLATTVPATNPAAA
eukprot:m.289530 g.289530  ORF g.289530 m.289530 type:complete len:104 (-) comp16227_c3_seq2:189-500(-)